MTLKLAYYGNPILRQKARPVEQFDAELKKLIEEMFAAMEDEKGIGLAAPQIGVPLRLFVTCVPTPPEKEGEEWGPGERRVFINPTLSGHSEQAWDYEEGCLSIPGINGNVTRPFSLHCKALDADGNEHEGVYHALEARCIMHENDHINGVLFIDRMEGKEKKLLKPELDRVKKELGKGQEENVNRLSLQ